MRPTLLASGFHFAAGREFVGRRRIGRKAQFLATGAWVLALGTINPATVAAANVPGVLQHSEGDIAINLFQFGVDEPVAQFGATDSVVNPGGIARAEAVVQCADAVTCPNAGAIFQYVRGRHSAVNQAQLDGSLSIGANASAEGLSATASSFISVGLWQVAVEEAPDGDAQNEIDISGMVQIGASADAVASRGAAVASASVSAGIWQVSTALGIGGSATNSISNSGALGIGASASALSAGNAVADAAATGIAQFADARTQQFASTLTSGGLLVGSSSDTPSGPASASLANSGAIEINASADAVGNFGATADGAVLGIIQSVSGSDAEVDIGNSGSIDIAASANAEGGGTPRGVVFASGISQAATAIAFSNVESIDQNGVLTYQLSATPVGTAVASLANEGSISVSGEVNVVALGTGTWDEGLGVAFLDGLDQHANGGSAQANVDNSGAFNVSASVTVDSANVSNAVAIATGIDQAATAYASQATIVFANGTTTPTTIVGGATAMGPATASLQNSGLLTVLAEVESHGDQTAYAGATASAIGQYAAGTHATVSINNSGTLASVGTISSDGHRAYGAAAGIGFQQGADGTAVADAIFENGGTLSVFASADAEGASGAFVNATAFGGAQIATANEQAAVDFANTGTIEIGALAGAVAGGTSTFDMAMAFGVAHGIGQSAEGQMARVGFENSGSFELLAQADAVADEFSMASAGAVGAIRQIGIGTASGSASASFNNNESLIVGANAEASAGSVGISIAGIEGAVSQAILAGESGSASINNVDTINLMAVAEVFGVGGATADSVAANAYASGIVQSVNVQTTQFGTATVFGMPATQTFVASGFGTANLANSGSIDLGLRAEATAEGIAFAAASGEAILQSVTGLEAQASLTNSGMIDAAGHSLAQADGTATATGYVGAIVQSAAGIEAVLQLHATSWGGVTSSISTQLAGFAGATLTNSGSIDVVGLAEAEAANGQANATMEARGIVQNLLGLGTPEASFTNSGQLTVGVRAEAVAGSAASADALATGYEVTGNNAAIDVSNSGEIAVLVEASADGANGLASAHAIGLDAIATADGFLNGMIDNSGDLIVTADAEVAGTGSVIAQATGVRVSASSSNLNLGNSGVISVSAATNGGPAEATAIKFAALGAGAADPSAEIVITNNGATIIARRSDDGGQTWLRGTAIDVSAAPSSSIVNLVGTGSIYGNIDVAAGDTINVTGGETWFDGIINAECQFSACGQGTLNIGNGGALFFRHNSAGRDGPSAAFVEQLNMASDGTLVFELPAGDDPESAYPQLMAGVANLDGTLLVRSETGLYGDSYQFDNVIDADVRNGHFDMCGIDGHPALLELNCVYDAEGNVDLGIERLAFNAVEGLTRNQAAVGSGIEAVYDIGLTGPFAGMVEQLFTFSAADYRDALDQLAGASHAAYLQSFNSLGVQHNELIDRAIGCELPGREASSLSCRTGKLNLWGQLDFSNRNSDGDQEAAGYDADRWTAIIGGDVEVRPDAIVGASLAKRGNRLAFHNGNRSNADGYQLGAYGAIDPGTYYAKVIGTIGWYDGGSSRKVDWTQFGGTLSGQLQGDPDVRLWTLGAHFGYRVALGETSLLTPFLNIDHSAARLDDFTETGLTAANLAIDESKSSRTVVTLGAKWAAEIGGAIPQAELGYRHLFGDRRSSVDAAFAAEAGSDFEVVSAADKRSSLLAGLSLGGKTGQVDVRVGYQGLFDGNSTSHSGGVRIIMPLGGR
jgi:trimeric autotransporter adhesin